MADHDDDNVVGSFDLEERVIMCKMCNAWGGLDLYVVRVPTLGLLCRIRAEHIQK